MVIIYGHDNDSYDDMLFKVEENDKVHMLGLEVCLEMKKQGVEDARVVYQMVMTLIFHDFIDDFMKVYIDDGVVKLK